ncbi:hypothetical protein HELRODRAFT_184218 [Helobdella robusta]|uniref:Zinc finger PHD-type domain-containing protein n=1 Tax=Helobdella robusta TaxID=6412 RepID=T1FKS6_HELRO|nr:hypothetical protein HELRODRAFT_184218 [Helobdella robusta]ESO04835.1 hypothetical protein HELRODRAFT_184218 [Helobdella robusta]
MICLHHIISVCSSRSTSSFKLLYKYTMEQLNEKVDHLQTQLHGFKSWIIKAKIAMEAKGRDRLALSSMQCILKEARENNFPSCPTLEALKRECEFGERCQTVACMLLGPDGNIVSRRKVKRRRSKRKKGVAADDYDDYDDEEEDVVAGEVDSKLEDKEKVSYEEFMTIVNRMDRLSFKLMCAPKLKELSIRIEKFRKKLQTDIQKHPLDNELIDSYFDQCYEYPVEVPELAMLHQCLSLISWLEEVSCIQNETIQLSCETVLRLRETGLSFATSDPKIESSLEFLEELITTFKKLEFKASTYTFNKPWQSVEDVERLVIECQESKMVIPSIGLLSSALKDAKEWCSAAEEITKNAPVTRRRSMLMLSGSNDESVVKPKLEDLDNLISKSQQIPISLPQLENIINIKSQVTGWIAQLSHMLLKSSQQSLLKMLLPRKDIPSLIHKSTKSVNSTTKVNNKNSCVDSNNEDDDGFISLDNSSSSLDFPHLDDEYLEILRKAEITDMQMLRQVNEKKIHASPCGSIGHCICGLGKYGSMVKCSLCYELYHYSCVEYSCIPQTLSFPLLSPFDILKTFDNFLCPRCNRTNRQRASELNNFVAMYNNDLEVVFQEGLALGNLMKRAEEWKLKMKAFIKGKPNLKVLENLWRMLANGDDIGNLNDKFLFTENIRKNLMELLLEGDLIEVHMSERYLLRYALQCHDASTFKTRIYSFPDVLPDVIKTLPRKTSHPRKRNKRCSRDGLKIQGLTGINHLFMKS